MSIPYKCPSCGDPLILDQRSWRCDNKHCFDVAKEGYVNLHLVHQKNSKAPGDSEAMLKSRRKFLEQQHYLDLAQGIHALLPETVTTLLDFGCGEGYYLAYLQQKRENLRSAGIDISKAGVRLAAKRKLNAQFAVASVYDLPFFDESFDCALSVFSPICVEEVSRILRPGGLLLAVGPGPSHLQELAACIYDDVSGASTPFADLYANEGFASAGRETLQYSIQLSGEQALCLLEMTPYYWHARPEQIQGIRDTAVMTIQLHFELHQFKKS